MESAAAVNNATGLMRERSARRVAKPDRNARTVVVTDDELERAAVSMLLRLRGAVLRAPCPADAVFRRMLGPDGPGHLAHRDLARILREFDREIPRRVIWRVFDLMDLDHSGYVEEADWVTVMESQPPVVAATAPQAEEDEEEHAAADSLIGRVAAAVRRSGLSAGEAFRALCSDRGASLSPGAAQAMLRAFGDVSEGAVRRAASVLDANSSGFVEEDDFCRVIGGWGSAPLELANDFGL